MKLLLELFNKMLYKIGAYVGFLQLYSNPEQKQEIVDQFHKLYYNSHLQNKTWKDSYFLGTPIQKCPFDLFVYQEIINDIRPDIIVECGTASGGGALYLSSICDLINHGEVVTIDIVELENRPKHNRLTYLMGSSTSDEIFNKVKEMVKDKESVLVILDSDHSKDHVLKEMQMYNPLVTKGSYMIVEDSNVNSHPVQPNHGPGPMEAIDAFMESNNDFEIDRSREKHYLTFNPRGYLKKQ